MSRSAFSTVCTPTTTASPYASFTNQWKGFEIEPDFGQHEEYFTPLGTETAASTSKDVGPIGSRKLKRKADVEPEVVDLTGDN